MVLSMRCWWFAGLVAALASPIAPAGDDPATEIAELGGRCSCDAAGQTIGVDLSKRYQNVGDPEVGDDELPVFWACGLTPQLAVKNARPPLCITHAPSCMLITDLRNSTLATL